MNKKEIIEKTKEHMKQILTEESSGHGWWHVQNVWKTAKYIAEKEKADSFVVELTALLHDIADWKFNKDGNEAGPRLAREWLEKFGVEEEIIEHVCDIMRNMSFKGVKVESIMKTKEGKVVQDADRLDAMGAIGIARTFTTGASFGRPIYDPEKPLEKGTDDLRKKQSESSIHHFYDKIFILKNLMNTKTGKRIAEKRDKFAHIYLEEFLKEWKGKDFD